MIRAGSVPVDRDEGLEPRLVAALLKQVLDAVQVAEPFLAHVGDKEDGAAGLDARVIQSLGDRQDAGQPA